MLNNEKFTCVFLNVYYPQFLQSLYTRKAYLLSQPYKVQIDAILGEFFGDSDFYSGGLKKTGWDAEDLIINCIPLQQAWANENSFRSYSHIFQIAIEQIRRQKPTVVYIQDLNTITKDFIDFIKPYTKLIVGQISCPIYTNIPFNDYDILISADPNFIQSFRQIGLTAYYQPLAFEPRVVKSVIPNQERPIACSFVGGLSQAHSKSYGLLEFLAGETPIEFWGYGVETLPNNSLIRHKHHGEVWGKDMFNILLSSNITINRHIDIIINHAGNMRLYEATGCGALLITDYKDNLNEIFEIGKEVVAYHSPQECASLIKYYMANPNDAEKIARAGQIRTLREYTYEKRMHKTAEILERHLRYQRERGSFPLLD